ncbi:MAG: DNA-3-methyladenine glycosylase [Bacteroidota bacterium]
MKPGFSFYQQDVLNAAPLLLGMRIVRRFDDGTEKSYIITETEAYRGEEDLACHACKGRTARTEVMYHEGGKIYVYLIYGMYWMLNVVTGTEENPQAVLIRGIEGFGGPGKLGRELQLDKSFYGENLLSSKRIWIEDTGLKPKYSTHPRINIEYAGKPWTTKKWRFMMKHI